MKRARTLAPSGMRLRSAVCAPPSYLEEMHSNLSCRHPAHGQAPGNHTLRGKGSSMPLGHGVFRQVIIDPVLLPAAPNPRLFALLTTAFDVRVQTGYKKTLLPLSPKFATCTATLVSGIFRLLTLQLMRAWASSTFNGIHIRSGSGRGL